MEVKIPAVGESITEATIAEWLKADGDMVQRDDALVVLETDKASVEVVAEAAGKLTIKVPEDETVEVGTVIALIDTDASAGANDTAASAKPTAPPTPPTTAANTPPPPPPGNTQAYGQPSPAAQKILAERQIPPAQVSGTGKDGRITKADALQAQSAPTSAPTTTSPSPSAPPLPQAQKAQSGEAQTRKKMSPLRKKIAERLVQAQHTAAILTTFNEIDMSRLMKLRSQYKDSFKEKHGLSLGFMGFFVKAVIEALKTFPAINAQIEGEEIVYNNFFNIGIAVGTPRGLVVPVIRHADQLTLAEIEQSIRHYALKARDGKIELSDLEGGTFTISNGGVYGSLMSTPILNPPQSGILGMHKIEERPVALNGQVEIRPMMYVALSYDHRMVDGAESVQFLVRIKECLEDPTRILLEV